MRIQTISDTHNNHGLYNLAPCDVIVHAGDFSVKGTQEEAEEFLDWFGHLPYTHRILVPGNHDVYAERNLDAFRKACDELDITLLIDESIVIDGVKFWGSPVTCRFGYGWAWNRDRSKTKAIDRLYRGVEDAKYIGDHWDLIPDDVDVVVCHQPPFEILDGIPVVMAGTPIISNVGCPLLREKIAEVKPKLFVCGHIHQDNGTKLIDGVKYINTATTIHIHEL